jgi:hypothetical protein
MQSATRDLSSGSEPRPAHVNEQRDTVETNGCGDAGASSVGCTSESVEEKVLLLFAPGDISILYKHIF